ncbi:hypothetical protein CEXT_655701 [Caerostris extrusa]|uniref:Uncharacterized protein n=1 Tax=Caerostris extrusa TaxID=172846 RepID=A0AAV4U4W8_CAEEX|nr:hypothetical protein CEXT_655701 [Caerostris extrusa]
MLPVDSKSSCKLTVKRYSSQDHYDQYVVVPGPRVELTTLAVNVIPSPRITEREREEPTYILRHRGSTPPRKRQLKRGRRAALAFTLNPRDAKSSGEF